MTTPAAILRNPATGQALGEVRVHTVQDLAKAVTAARAAQKAWAALPARRRAKVALAMRSHIANHVDEIADAISRSTGKTRVDALSTEVLPSALAAGYYARVCPRIHKRRKIGRGSILLFNKKSYLTRVPYGVVGIISPWNYPFSIPFHEVVTALLAGNAVVLKVATQTQLVGDRLAQVVEASGLPAGLFHLVHIPGKLAGSAMLAAGVNKLFFTGSTTVGKELMEKASRTLTPLVLELGGNDAMIVLDDADPDRAASGALWAGLSNAGQSCAGVERIYVSAAVYPAFRDSLGHQAAALRLGPDTSFDVDIGSLTVAEQKEKVDRMVADAVSLGAVVACRREADPGQAGLFSPVLILEDVTEGMQIMKEEVFGPVLALQVVQDEEEAVRKANDSIYGLSASVWSKDRARARRVAERLEAGTVTINDHLMSHGLAETPWGGFKESGIGRSHGELGFLEMTQPRVIVDDWLSRAPRNMWWYPHNAEVYQGLKGALTALFGKGLGGRVGALVRLVRLFLRSFRRSA